VLCIYAHEASGPKQQLVCPMCRDDTTYRRQLRQVRRDLKDVPGFGADAPAAAEERAEASGQSSASEPATALRKCLRM
jgi:hypothetical protein